MNANRSDAKLNHTYIHSRIVLDSIFKIRAYEDFGEGSRYVGHA